MARRKERKISRTRELDFEAREEERTGSNKKKFSIHDLRMIHPKTPAQEDVFHASMNYNNLLLYGSPGTGKTFLSMWLAFKNILDPRTPYKKLIIVRSIAATREPGALPGELDLKVAPFEEPYIAICNELFPYKNSYENLKKNGYLEFVTTSFLRGVTFGREDEGVCVIFDECQNTRDTEFFTVLSRVGENCKLYIVGDTAQVDLNKKNDVSVFKDWIPALKDMSTVGSVEFSYEDIVRSGFVKELVKVKDRYNL